MITALRAAASSPAWTRIRRVSPNPPGEAPPRTGEPPAWPPRELPRRLHPPQSASEGALAPSTPLRWASQNPARPPSSHSDSSPPAQAADSYLNEAGEGATPGKTRGQLSKVWGTEVP